MPFPASPRIVFDKNPLNEVICQLRFPAILSIAAEAPSSFQDKVRGIYPIYERNDGGLALPKEFAEIASRLPIQFRSENVTHKFSTPDQKRAMSLATNFISISFANYIRWEDFREEVERALVVLEEVYRPAFFTRVGLRYQNLIDKQGLGIDNRPWSDLLSPVFAGLLSAQEIREDVDEYHAEGLLRVSQVPGGRVKLRYGLAFSPPEPPNTPIFLIDADFFTQERSDREQALNTLKIFNRIARDFFRWAITPDLADALVPRSIEP